MTSSGDEDDGEPVVDIDNEPVVDIDSEPDVDIDSEPVVDIDSEPDVDIDLDRIAHGGEAFDGSGGLTSLDSLLADRTPEPHSPTDATPADTSRPDGRTYVRQSVGVGEIGHVDLDRAAGVTPDPSTEPPHVSVTGSSAGLLLHVPVDAIQPNEFQPRRRFDETALASLTDSVRELGVLQPILIRRLPARHRSADSTIEFELVAGERRWRAARRAGLTKVPAIVRDVSDLRSLEEAIVENLHRSDLNPLEEAAAYQQLIDEFGLSQGQVAQRVGKSRSAVANTLRLTQLPVSVQRLVVAGELTAGHGRAVLVVPSFDQPDFAARIVAEQLSVREAEQLAQDWPTARGGNGTTSERSTSRGSTPQDGDAGSGSGRRDRSAGALEVERRLGDVLDTRVRVEEAKNGGRVVIDYADGEDLSRIFTILERRSSDPDS